MFVGIVINRSQRSGVIGISKEETGIIKKKKKGPVVLLKKTKVSTFSR